MVNERHTRFQLSPSTEAEQILASLVEEFSRHEPRLRWIVVSLSCLAKRAFFDYPDPVNLEERIRQEGPLEIAATDLAKLLGRIREAYDETCIVGLLPGQAPDFRKRDLWDSCEIVMEFVDSWSVDVTSSQESETAARWLPEAVKLWLPLQSQS